MTLADLPEDLAQWPGDPFALFGVGRSASLRELKRAYAQRIRRFKPEHFPEHFRRIRDAYEFVERYLALYGELDREPPGAEAGPGLEPAADDPLPSALSEPKAAADEVSLTTIDDAVEEVWRSARSADRHDVYARLSALARQGADDEELCLRLYWLLSLWPEMEPERSPAEWLVRGFGSGRPVPRLLELYARWLAKHPEEALGDRCTRLVESKLPAAVTQDLAEPRWRAAAAAGRYEVLAGDLGRLRQRLAHDDLHGWMRLLLAAADVLAWSDAPAAVSTYQACLAELRRHQDSHLELDREFDRLDFLGQLVADWRRWRASLDTRAALALSLADLIRTSWYTPLDYAQPLLEVLQPMVESPEKGLAALDYLAANARAVLHRLGGLIGQLHSRLERPEACAAEEEVRRRLSAWLDRVDWTHYTQLRLRLLRFCAEQWITTQQLSDLLLSTPEGSSAHDPALAVKVLDDAPLAYLSKAMQVFAA